MPSFDVVNKIDIQTLDNAINVARKDLAGRYDFKGSKLSIELDKKALNINISAENEMRIEAIEDTIRSRMIKQGLNPMALDFGKERYAAGNMIKKDIKVKQGIDKDTARKITKHIKELKLKVEAQIMDEQVRVSGKKIDDLQAVIASLRSNNFDIPLQFVNLK
ncbi:MAG: YajQ family cyclic di-GMP-binding protein [Bacteroidia bacterium]|nr:YajQ family cyclic di-GMP-binding protein [Bacteroidia bacterium]MCZ2248231.1 YajQ family cyclic di-GMP-binding protein [Bacteroidia bacterium]